jgi:hypothetical protein
MIHPHFQIWQPCLFLIPGHIKCTNKFKAQSSQFDPSFVIVMSYYLVIFLNMQKLPLLRA